MQWNVTRPLVHFGSPSDVTYKPSTLILEKPNERPQS